MLNVLVLFIIVAVPTTSLSIAGAEEQEEESVDMNFVMGALVAANRLGFSLLTQHCERLLSLHLGEYFPHNAENCLSFAAAYNIPRLERQCLKVLKRPVPVAVEEGILKGVRIATQVC